MRKEKNESIKRYIAWEKAFRSADSNNELQMIEEKKRVAELKRKKAEGKDAKTDKTAEN